MAQRRSKEAPLSACPVTSESSRISDRFQDYDFAVLSPGLPDDTSIPRYLGVESVAGCPQFAHALDDFLQSSSIARDKAFSTQSITIRWYTW